LNRAVGSRTKKICAIHALQMFWYKWSAWLYLGHTCWSHVLAAMRSPVLVLYVVYRLQSVGGDFAEEWTAICFHICFLEHGLRTFTTRKLIQSRRSFVHASIVRFYGSVYRKCKEKASEGCCSQMI
jgi:hypothetical protein